jgi:hypothetical protein
MLGIHDYSRKIFIGALSIALFTPCLAYAEASSDTDQFIEEITASTIAVHCANNQFLTFSGMSEKTCFRILKEHSAECNTLIRPVIPEVTGTDKDLERLKMVGSIGSMYSMCLKALVYEDGHCSPRDKTK